MVFGFSTILDILPLTTFIVTICDLLPNCFLPRRFAQLAPSQPDGLSTASRW